MNYLEIIGASSGLIGAILIFFFGIPPKIDPKGHIHMILEQEDENEKIKARKYKFISNFGLLLLILSFVCQLSNSLIN